jgi:hypothetical protein
LIDSNGTKALASVNGTFVNNGGTGADLASPVQFRIIGGGTNAGTYALQPFGAISSTRSLVFANGTLTVNQAQLTVTANDVTRLQGSSSPAFSDTVSGLVNGDTAQSAGLIFFVSQGFSTSPPGFYSVRPFGGINANPNYQLQFVNGTLTIVPAPPPPNPLETVTFVPGTVTPTTTTTTETFTPTTLTKEEVAPVTTTITVNPFIGTPYAIFGPLMETIVQEITAASGGKTEDQVLAFLLTNQNDPAVIALLTDYLYTELDNILFVPQSQWTADQTTFVNGVMSYINAQRAAAADKAMIDYEAWAKAAVAKENAEIEAVPDGPAKMIEIQIMSGNPPMPPDTFLVEAKSGMDMSDAQAGIVLQAATDGSDLNTTMNAIDTVAQSAGLISYGANFVGVDAKSFSGKLAQKIFPYLKKSQYLDEKRGAKNSPGDETETETETTVKNATNETKEVEEGTTVAETTLETASKVVAVAGLVGELAGNILQVGIGVALYGEVATYNADFTAAVNAAKTPLSVADLKTMVMDGSAYVNIMAELASGNPMAFGNPLNNPTKPDMSLQSIVNITSQL